MTDDNFQILPSCGKDAEGLDIILACDGASSVGQVGHEVAVKLTKEVEGARMCCITAVGAGSQTHINIARKARKLIIINGCPLECASKVVRNIGIEPSYEITISKEGVDKVPTLDFKKEDVNRISNHIVDEVKRMK
ncbi:MAG TPA: zinc-binding protein [candidate division WOR-3 bacterium]|uniref:Zinc-binding protein n=1 Tax=candidate division WOR-3 bacterium TaxID=2052148 RepID=A0A7C5DB44_UNCW3|nr:zinc-binding protein [candidate division WOR-3 bacterium]